MKHLMHPGTAVALLSIVTLSAVVGGLFPKCRICGLRKLRQSWPKTWLNRAIHVVWHMQYCDTCLTRFSGGRTIQYDPTGDRWDTVATRLRTSLLKH
jgi:hypothetical protein